MKDSLRFRAFILTICLVTGICIFTLPVLFGQHHSEHSYTAYIYKNGILTKTIPLSHIQNSGYLEIGDPADPAGEYNLIEYKKGRIRIAEAGCPDRICVNQGFIDSPLLPITCLPNGLVITIKADHTEPSVDMIVY